MESILNHLLKDVLKCKDDEDVGDRDLLVEFLKSDLDKKSEIFKAITVIAESLLKEYPDGLPLTYTKSHLTIGEDGIHYEIMIPDLDKPIIIEEDTSE